MKRLSKLIKLQSADTKNYEGFPAWSMPLEKRFRQVLFTGTFGNTFYARQSEIVYEGLQVLKEGVEKLSLDYVVSTIEKARNDGFIRTAPIIALIFLRDRDKNAFKELFPKVIITGNDMEDFMTLSRALDKGFGRCVKYAMKEWLKNVDEFYAIKYKRQIADVMRIVHPWWESPELDYVASAFKKVEGLDRVIEKLPQIKAFEEAKKLLRCGRIGEAIEYIRSGRVPATALLGVISTDDPEYWAALAEQMGTMQLLKYINKLTDVGVSVEYIKSRINVAALKGAKVLPFRVAVAARNVKNAEIADYLLTVAIDYSRQYEWNKWTGRWIICPDVSASMNSTAKDITIRPADVAAVFSGILKAGLPNSKVLAWADNVHDYSDMSPMGLIETISAAPGGSTYMERPIDYMMRNKIEADYVLFITDSEEWGEGWIGYWSKYKMVNKGAKAIFIRVDPYNTQPYSLEHEIKYDIYDVFGWSDSVLLWIEERVLSD